MAKDPVRSGKKNRKHNRNKKTCESYRQSGTREKNKARKAEKRISKALKLGWKIAE